MGLEPQSLTWREVFGDGADDATYLAGFLPAAPVTFFVGPNGSGKTKTAFAYAQRCGQNVRRLSTDRLVGVMNFAHYGWASIPQGGSRGIPIGGSDEQQLRSMAPQGGIINDAFYILRDNPDIYLRVNSILSRIFRRDMRLSETAGYIEPTILFRQSDTYSLFQDEGHGLRELIALLTYTYYGDSTLLVIDEPELHLHPSMARFWVQELYREFVVSGRRAIIVTHDPNLIRPMTFDDLGGVWVFREGQRPQNMLAAAHPSHRAIIDGSLSAFPDIVASLVFSPRPVLVEGVHDRAALETALRRSAELGVSAQTDFVPCQGSSGVAAWFEIARQTGIDVVAVADLDALLDPSFQRAMDRNPQVAELYASVCLATPARTSEVLRDLYIAMNTHGIAADPKERARWLAGVDCNDGGLFHRKAALLTAWREAGVWLHEEGTLEAVLGITDKASVETARTAASTPGRIDDVAAFSRYRVTVRSTLEEALNNEVRRIVHEIQRELARTPDLEVHAPIGPTADFDGKLVDVRSIGGGRVELLVKSPLGFSGRRVEFTVDTPTSQIVPA